MSLKLTPYPTAKALQAALDNQASGISLQGRFIGVGTGLQTIQLDDAGRAITDRLKQPIAWLPILNAERVNPYQWQLTVDVAGTNNSREYNLSEIALSSAETVETANDHVIAIYGNARQALMTISPQVDHALIAINLLLGTMPADSVEIVHQNLPLDLSITEELVTVMVSVGQMSADIREQAKTQWQQQITLDALEVQGHAQQQQLDHLLTWQQQAQAALAEQQRFNTTTHNAFGQLSGVI